jgi:hypothetical protein
MNLWIVEATLIIVGIVLVFMVADGVSRLIQAHNILFDKIAEQPTPQGSPKTGQ